MVYGYSWYLDAVTSLPGWKWVGLILADSQGNYQAVLPIPLRRKYGIWIVHQPLFCQFLDVFAPTSVVDASLFFRALQRKYWYGSIFFLRQRPPAAPHTVSHSLATWLLDLGQPYRIIQASYTADRQRNLRNAQAFGWSTETSTDVEPMLTLFRQHHAGQVPGGVGEWAYDVFRTLVAVLQQHGLATIRYATYEGRTEAGALFVQEGQRIIYLFNAASALGRKENARTLLIDQLIQEKAGTTLWFDFESPEKASIANFYRSFGSKAEPFYSLRWNTLRRFW